ncbi:hypothetical protein lbkm_0566 [Lachnospiraceae bacterium KM106-2]|nr:hypothetical protein lbkm_0566 [Lachnospiraceae bacterium KM106-2]
MFEQLFGYFLVEHKILTEQQLVDALSLKQSQKVKLGTIARSLKLLNVQQVEQIYDRQLSVDKRFGDLAKEFGYLKDEEIETLLRLQGDTYMKFIQVLMNQYNLSLEEIERELLAYQIEHNLTNSEMNILKSNDIDQILPLFLNFHSPEYTKLFSLTIHGLLRNISDDIILHPATIATSCPVTDCYIQPINNLTLAIDGTPEAIFHFNKQLQNKFPVEDINGFLDSIKAVLLSKPHNDIECHQTDCLKDTCLEGHQFVILPITLDQLPFNIIIYAH